MHLLGSEWRVVLAGFLLAAVMSFARSLMRGRWAAWFDLVLALLTIGVLVYVVRHVRP